MSLHSWFGRHEPDPQSQRWEAGHFVTQCIQCRIAMVKLPGLPWKLRAAA